MLCWLLLAKRTQGGEVEAMLQAAPGSVGIGLRGPLLLDPPPLGRRFEFRLGGRAVPRWPCWGVRVGRAHPSKVEVCEGRPFRRCVLVPGL